MIKEAYCSFEVAKLLKEKGFNEPCRDFYRKENDEWLHRNTYEYNYFNLQMPRWEGCYSCPTHQMAMAWLRIEHNILLFLLPAQENGKLVYLVEVWTWNEEEGIYESTYAPMPRKEPEKAIESALKYVLENLI